MSALNNKLAGQIGEYLVCAELGRRGLIATPFSGNVPTFDVLATDEQLRTVPIQVKTSRTDNWNGDARNWLDITLDKASGVQLNRGLKILVNPELIYVYVAIAKPGEHDRFFVLTMADAQKAYSESYTAFMKKHEWRRPRNPESFDNRVHIGDIAKFEDNWELITTRLKGSAPDSSLTTELNP